MDPSPPRKELSLQGPRPAALKIQHDSHKIKKPPPHKPPQHHHRKPAEHSDDQPRQPVIIYSVSPKVIYADESEFRSLVQRLTGPSPEFTSAGDVSPAARLATVEKTRSPTERDRLESSEELTSAVMAEGLEMSQIPGILSPAPGNLPPIPAGFFSPVVESPQWQTLGSMAPDFSPNFRYGFSGGFTTSPSALFPAPNMSPTISYDLFNHFMDP
uniref:VQ domain-containing protein n=1 Tax=Kalanchoe fedtschenkoi TaxID=63787 RepID=A0A7N0V203_KALFE